MQFPKITWKKALIGLGVLVVGGIVYGATRKPVTTYETVSVDRGTVVEEVSVTGTLTPTSHIALEPEAAARVTKINVDEGSDVKAGDVLVELDAREVSARVASQQASVASAKARLAELVAGATPQELAQSQAALDSAITRRDAAIAAKADAESAVANAEAKGETLSANSLASLLVEYDGVLTDAKDALERQTLSMFTFDGQLTFSTNNFNAEVDARSTRVAAKAAVIDMETAILTAKTGSTAAAAMTQYSRVALGANAVKAHLDATRLALSYATNLSSTTLSTYQSSVGTASAAVESGLSSASAAKSALDLQMRVNTSEVTSTKTALNTAAFALQSAEKSLAQAQADLTLRLSGNRPEVIASQRAQVALQEASLNALYADLAKRRIVSPIDGIVTDVAVELGETVSQGSVAVELQAKGAFEIVTNVSEIDIGKVQVGDAVQITLDAFPRSEKWTGKVVTVDPAEKVVEGVIFYETKVVFDNEDPRLRSGMTANLVIETERREDALRVPLRGVKDRRDKSFVEVLVNGAPEEREIVMGIQNTDHGEVLSGISEGDLIVVGSTTK